MGEPVDAKKSSTCRARLIFESSSRSMSRIMHLRIERTKAQELGFSAHDIAQNLLVSLSGSFQTSPTFWLDPKNGVSYSIATQTPQYRADTLQDLVNTPVTGTNPSAPSSIMASLVSTQRGAGMAVVSHYNVAPVLTSSARCKGAI